MEYDGTRYHGSQYQTNAPTIQGETEHALERLTGEKVRIALASRTDAGVHAKGQVVSFKTNSTFAPKTWVRALNHYLPPDIAIKAAYYAEDDFDVRRHAWSREYRYSILNTSAPSPLMRRYTCFVSHPLDTEDMDRACQELVGEHDFASFSGMIHGQARRRVYRAEVSHQDNLVIFDIEASSFLPHQVRNTVGGLIRVGLGKLEVESFWALAQSGRPGAVGPAAPTQGLCLTKINYHDFPPFEEM
jgi:tRNA pseudouridine38-40 synthase